MKWLVAIAVLLFAHSAQAGCNMFRGTAQENTVSVTNEYILACDGNWSNNPFTDSTTFDAYGFDHETGLHRDTKTKWDPDGYDINGFDGTGWSRTSCQRSSSYNYRKHQISGGVPRKRVAGQTWYQSWDKPVGLSWSKGSYWYTDKDAYQVYSSICYSVSETYTGPAPVPR